MKNIHHWEQQFYQIYLRRKSDHQQVTTIIIISEKTDYVN